MGTRGRLIALASALLIGGAATPSAVAPAASRPPLFGVMMETLSGDAAAKEVLRAVQLHAEVVRVRVTWRLVEPQPGHYDWSLYDDLLPRLRAAGIRPLLLVLDAPTWARSSGDLCLGAAARCPPGPDHVADYAAFVAAVAQRYSTGTLDAHPAGIEVWNEPNHPVDWQTSRGPDPARYAQLLIAAGRAVHAAAPRIPVAVGGLAAGGDAPRYQQVSTERQLQAVYDAGGADAFDAIAVHAYTGRTATTPVGESLAVVRDVVDRVVKVRDAYRDNTTPLWITETGIRDPQEVGPSQTQASLLLALYDEFARQPAVRMVLIFRLAEIARNPGWGLIDANDEPRSSFPQLAAGMLARLPAAPGSRERLAHRRARTPRRARLKRRSATGHRHAR